MLKNEIIHRGNKTCERKREKPNCSDTSLMYYRQTNGSVMIVIGSKDRRTASEALLMQSDASLSSSLAVRLHFSYDEATGNFTNTIFMVSCLIPSSTTVACI